MANSDESLIRRFKNGDEESFKELVKRYQARIYSIVFAMMGDKNDADDICQEIFVKLYRSLYQFRGKSKFFTWLYRLTVNTCINAQNGRKRKLQTISLSHPVGESEQSLVEFIEQDGENCSIDILKNKELGMKINSAIDCLSDDLKEVFILREIEDLSYRELAKILQCSEGTIKSRLFRARDRLKEKLLPYINNS
ncbi:sigma-70 family RNA polymerase sigma factor [Candidatus Aerophobetes bacterium]|nr:sigma-70 family RNA polymerase sigma factor [Candidatus Aerophobetes bacterium]